MQRLGIIGKGRKFMGNIWLCYGDETGKSGNEDIFVAGYIALKIENFFWLETNESIPNFQKWAEIKNNEKSIEEYLDFFIKNKKIIFFKFYLFHNDCIGNSSRKEKYQIHFKNENKFEIKDVKNDKIIEENILNEQIGDLNILFSGQANKILGLSVYKRQEQSNLTDIEGAYNVLRKQFHNFLGSEKEKGFFIYDEATDLKRKNDTINEEVSNILLTAKAFNGNCKLSKAVDFMVGLLGAMLNDGKLDEKIIKKFKSCLSFERFETLFLIYPHNKNYSEYKKIIIDKLNNLDIKESIYPGEI
jgi:hypothetical protein